MTEPVKATNGAVWLDIECPCCQSPRSFTYDEMEELDCGSAWAVADSCRFDHCEECGAFVDYGDIALALMRRDG